MAAVIVVGTRIVVGGVVGEQMVDRDEHGVRDSDDGFLVPTAPHDTAVPGGEGPLRRMRAGAEGSLDEGAAQPAVPFARPAGGVFAGTPLLPGQRPAQLARCPAVGNS